MLPSQLGIIAATKALQGAVEGSVVQIVLISRKGMWMPYPCIRGLENRFPFFGLQYLQNSGAILEPNSTVTDCSCWAYLENPMQLLSEGSSHPPWILQILPLEDCMEQHQSPSSTATTHPHPHSYICSSYASLSSWHQALIPVLKAKTLMENLCQDIFSFLFCFPTEAGGKCKLLTSASSFLFLECISLLCPFAHASYGLCHLPLQHSRAASCKWEVPSLEDGGRQKLVSRRALGHQCLLPLLRKKNVAGVGERRK